MTRIASRFRSFFCLLTVCLLSLLSLGATPADAGKTDAGKSDVLLNAMQQELQRARTELGKADPAPYFMGYQVYDQDMTVAVGGLGSLMNSTRYRARTGEAVMRVGSPDLDNGHLGNRSSALLPGQLPLEDDPDAIARSLWQLTYNEYRRASRTYLNVKTGNQVNAQEEDTSADFSKEKAQVHTDFKAMPPLPNQAALEKLVRQYSALLKDYPYIYSSAAIITAQTTRSYFVSTEGSKVVIPNSVVRLMIQGETRADDGMDLMRVETFQAESVDRLPSAQEVSARVKKMAEDLKALRAAPLAQPFDGPALLSGRSSAVFFHEVLGHRVEGQRQRGEDEGQTFTKKVNEKVLPEFLSVKDDPTARVLNGIDLSGWYEFDDEGMPAQRVDVIQNGILKSFLMSRMPVKGFSNSNGHGRSQAGLMPVGRQGNLIVTSSNSVKDAEMRQKLIDEVKKQGKPYGLYFEDIEGGFTLTTTELPQAFQILPVMVWKVYPDGKPDELVRGVDIVGTPLAAMNRILVTGDKTEVFNGMCGAESGSIPVSAAAPAMLFSEIEVQRRSHSLTRPPILPPPGFENPANTEVRNGGAQ